MDFEALTGAAGDNGSREEGVPNKEQTDPPPSPKKRRFELTPFVPINPLELPPRKWLYAKHYQRGIVSATIAPGGAGKSSLNLVDAIVMATARPLLGEAPEERCRVWIHNGEEPRDELSRRILAICQWYNIPQEELKDWLGWPGRVPMARRPRSKGGAKRKSRLDQC